MLLSQRGRLAQALLRGCGRPRAQFSLPTPQTLESIVKLELLVREPPEQVAAIWEAHHSGEGEAAAGGVRGSGLLGSALSRARWETMSGFAASHPLFVLPVPKGPPGAGAFVCFYLQWQARARDARAAPSPPQTFSPPPRAVQDRHVLFTLLEEFQRRGSASQPHLTLTHYTDLADTKELVLQRGEVSSPELSVAEARTLAKRVEEFYSEPEGQRLVAAFNSGSSDFAFSEVLAACGIAQQPTR